MILSYPKISWREIPEALAILIPQASQQFPNMAPQKHLLQITMALDFAKATCQDARLGELWENSGPQH